MSIFHYAISQQSLILVLIQLSLALSVISFSVGAGLLLNPPLMQRIFQVMNRWVSLRRSTKWMNVPRDIGPTVQRHRHIIGLVIVLVAAYSLFSMADRIDANRLASMLRMETPRIVVTWLIDSIYWMLVVGNLIAIATGVMLVAFPSALSRLEAHANGWHSFRRASLGADDMHTGLDRAVSRHPRASGLAIAMPALGLIVHFAMLWSATA